MHDRSHLLTERRLPDSMRLDAMRVPDALAVDAVGRVGPEIARAIDLVVAALSAGGRLIYFGAGTSGRLGVLDASECPPTFSTPPDQVVGVIAGGPDALTH